MSFYLIQAWQYVRGAQPEPPPRQLEVPQVIKENTYLTVSAGMALLQGPKHLALGVISALFTRLVADGTVPSQHRPLAERFLTVIEPVLDQPITVADMVAFSTLMLFDEFAPLTSWWIGVHAAMLVLHPRAHRD